ncbi:MAG: hypothetical protein ACE5HX_15060, partial [bacterium]
MFRKTSPQSSVFDVNSIMLEALPQDDWSYTYKDKILPLLDEEAFKHFYSETTGQPNGPIKAMVSLLIFMGLEKLTWRATEYLFGRRLDGLNATNTPLGEASVDHTTIFKFYQRLQADDTAIELFVKLTDAFVKLCGTSLNMQRSDSFFIYENIKGQLSQDYLGKDFDLTEKDKELAHKKVSLMAQDLYQLISAFENHKQIQHYETFKILSTVFSQQCEVKERTDSTPEIIIKEKPDTDAICTPHNPEARYVRKGKQRITGDKAVVTETCNPENKTQFITDIDVNEATKHDTKDQPEIQDRLIDHHFNPEKQYEDAGFVNGETILDSHEKGIELQGPTAGHSQSFETYTDKERPLDAGDFDTTIAEGGHELIVNKCPNNQAPKEQKRSTKTGKMIVHFDPGVCGACSFAQAHRCPVKVGKRVATYTVDETEYVGALRHHRYMSEPEYRKECATRAGVEATVSELTRT